LESARRGLPLYSFVGFRIVGVGEMLLEASQSTDIKLINVAQWVVEDHEKGLNRAK
jgi:hypothetical protein